MITFCAVTSRHTFIGSFGQCRAWGYMQLQSKQTSFVKIVKARPENKECPIIFEITPNGEYAVDGSRVIELRALKRRDRYG